MARRIVLFGASGYTGRLIAEALVRARARPVLAGRNYQSLAALGVRLGKGLDTAVADVTRPDSLLELVQPNDVLITTVGPFARFGRPVIEAAIYRRATYIDTCGEPPFIRAAYEELAPIAEQANVSLLPGFAFEFIAGNVAAATALENLAEPATRVDVAYFLVGGIRGNISLGTRASVGGYLLQPQFAWRDGALQPMTIGDRVEWFDVDGRQLPALAAAGSEHITIPRIAPSIREVGVYHGGPRRRFTARAASRAVGVGAKAKAIHNTFSWFSRLPGRAEGPDQVRRERATSEVIARVYAQDGRILRTVRMRGINPYTFTGEIVAWAALEIARNGLPRAGALGPVEAFGLGPLRDACATAGLPVVEG